MRKAQGRRDSFRGLFLREIERFFFYYFIFILISGIFCFNTKLCKHNLF